MIKFKLWLLLAAGLTAAPGLAATEYPTNPLLGDDGIYVSRQGVYKFSPGRSRPLWSQLVGVETFEPVLHEDLLLVGSSSGLYALRRETGALAWHIERSRTLFTPSVSQQAFAGSVHGELYMIDPDRGDIVWRRQFPGWIYSPAVDELSASLWTGGQMHRLYALALADGKLRQEIATSQEAVFSAVEIGANRVAINLFDGSTLVVAVQSGKKIASLAGASQPHHLQTDANAIYRSHRDGTLAVFDRRNLELKWRKTLTQQDLHLHPSRPGYLLLSDLDRDAILLDLQQPQRPCRLQFDGQLLLPAQLTTDQIIYFKPQMQPPGLSLVQIQAQCK